MMFPIESKVRFLDPISLRYEYGRVLSKADFDNSYWVEYVETWTQTRSVHLFSDEDLRKWNYIAPGCECGSDSMPDKTNRHSHWCVKFIDYGSK